LQNNSYPENSEFFIRLKLDEVIHTGTEKEITEQFYKVINHIFADYQPETIIFETSLLNNNQKRFVALFYVDFVCNNPNLKFIIKDIDIIKNIQRLVNNLY
jgi:uncharacterized protein (DUF488 family)